VTHAGFLLTAGNFAAKLQSDTIVAITNASARGKIVVDVA
jgi:hypothetical protein